MGKCNRPFADEGILRSSSEVGRPGRESDPLASILPPCCCQLRHSSRSGKKESDNHFDILEVSVSMQTTLVLYYQEWDCKVWSDDKSDIQIYKALSWFRNASLHCTDSIFNLGSPYFLLRSPCLSLTISHEGCVYMCPLQVTSRKRYLHLNEIKSYMSSVGAKYADIMA